MNINFEKLKWKNFLSYGSEFSEVVFSEGIDLVMGTNGQGKSTFNDALFYSLFGKAFRKVKSGSLINRTHKKKLVVELTFKIDAQRYKIIRGMKPNKFEIYLEENDDEGGIGEYILIEQRASTKDYQKFLEEEVLCINETIFRQLIVLGANLPSSKPFMELSQQEKESLFQVLTDTSIFGHLKTNLKLRMADRKHELKDYEYKRDILKSSLDSEKLMVEQAEKQNQDFKDHHAENIRITEENISTTEDNIKKYKNGLDKLRELKVVYDEEMAKTSKLYELFNDMKDAFGIGNDATKHTITQEYDKAIADLDSVYNSLDYTEMEDEISRKGLAISNTVSLIKGLENSLEFIHGAEKSAINCTSCETTNYLVNISEDEVQNKAEYTNQIKSNEALLETHKKEEQTLKAELTETKRKSYSEYMANKKEETTKRNKREYELQEGKKDQVRKIDALQEEISAALLVTDGYKEKLLNGKRLKEALAEYDTNLGFYQNKLLELQSIKIIEVNYDSLHNKEADMGIIVKNIKTINADSDNLIYLENLIGANNLKGAVIKRQIPFLNKGINHFLELFSMLEYSFVIDENFKERLISRDEDSEFNQLSNGQKARISFSIMFAFLKLIEERNGVKTNILVLDEILDSSVDASGREELLNILKSEFSETKNIIIISHNPEIKEKIELFDRLLHIKKDKFSSLKIENL